jgi:four helix bundle suffix protein
VICLIHQASYLLDRQLKGLEQEFIKEGGFTERLYRVRSQARGWNKSIKSIFITIFLLIFITGIWSFALMVIAVKTELSFKNPIRAIAICMIVPIMCVICKWS